MFVLKDQPGVRCQLHGRPWVANISYCSKSSSPSVADRPARKPTAVQSVSSALPGWGEQKLSNSSIHQIVLNRMLCVRSYEVKVMRGGVHYPSKNKQQRHIQYICRQEEHGFPPIYSTLSFASRPEYRPERQRYQEHHRKIPEQHYVLHFHWHEN
jgi:hypothetical protein